MTHHEKINIKNFGQKIKQIYLKKKKCNFYKKKCKKNPHTHKF